MTFCYLYIVYIIIFAKTNEGYWVYDFAFTVFPALRLRGFGASQTGPWLRGFDRPGRNQGRKI